MKRLLPLAFVTAFGTIVSAQSFEWDTPRSAVPTPHPKEVVVAQERGTAGVYPKEEQGKTTAYGETYDATEMTGSHPALPLGTLLKVTNTANGRSVMVRVTDQGKECADCLITLSEVAAKELGIASRGTVDLERSGFSNWNPLPSSNQTQKGAGADAAPSDRSVTGVVAPQPRKIITAPTTASAAVRQPSLIEKEVVPLASSDQDTPPTFARRVEGYTEQPAVASPAPTVGADQQARSSDLSVVVPTTEKFSPTAGDYAVQLAAYNNETYALRRVNELKEKGLADVYYRSITKADGQVINRVYVGAFGDADTAQAAAKEIQGKFNIAGIVAKM